MDTNWVNRWVHAYCRFLTAVIVALLAAMVVLVFGNVVLRYVANSGITVSEELSRWFFVWMTFLGAVVGLAMKATGALRQGRFVPFGPFLAGGGVVVVLAGLPTVLGWIGW